MLYMDRVNKIAAVQNAEQDKNFLIDSPNPQNQDVFCENKFGAIDS
jgi:hypothetical protein